MQPFSDEYYYWHLQLLFSIFPSVIFCIHQTPNTAFIYYTNTHNADYFLILTSTRRERAINCPIAPTWLKSAEGKADEFYGRKAEANLNSISVVFLCLWSWSLRKKIIVSVKLANLRLKNHRSFRFEIVVGHLKERNKWSSGAVKSSPLPQFTA